MFPDLLLNTDNPRSEVRFAPGIVASHVQVESVEIGKGRNRNESAKFAEQEISQIPQWPKYFEGNTAEKIIKYLTNPGVLKTIWKIWNVWKWTLDSIADPPVVDDEKDNRSEHKGLNAMPDRDPGSHEKVFFII